MKTSSFSPNLYLYSKKYKTFNQVLDVRYITGAYLIAMKLKSGREYKNDLSDIIGIFFEHEKKGDEINMKEIDMAVKNLYGGWNEIEHKSILFINSIVEDKKYEELYIKIKKTEEETQSILLEFNESYPGVLEETNIDSILEKQNNKKSKEYLKKMLSGLKDSNDKQMD